MISLPPDGATNFAGHHLASYSSETGGVFVVFSNFGLRLFFFRKGRNLIAFFAEYGFFGR